MKSVRTMFAVGLTLLMVAGMANAAVTTTLQTYVADQMIAGSHYTVYRLISDTTADWTNAYCDLQLTSGTIYQNSFGTNGAPNPAFFGMVTELAYDSFWTDPDNWPNTSATGGPSFPSDPTVTSTQMNASWFGNANSGDDIGQFTIMQFTVTQGAVGTIAGRNYDTSVAGVGEAFEFQIPEPATMLLLGLGGLGVVIRRRR